MKITLATTHHDPHGRMREQVARLLPRLTQVFGGIAMRVSRTTPDEYLEPLIAAGALVERDNPTDPAGVAYLGRERRAVVALALRQGAAHILYFDFDSMLHWAERYPDELEATVAELPRYDFCVIGRTQRALDTHPRSQRDTELMVSEVFSRLSGFAWDVMRSGRGLSRKAAEAIVAGCDDEAISTDVSWPLFLLRQGGFKMGEVRVEGTEFETADRYGPEVLAAGGYEAWLAKLDADPRRWAHRLNLARMHMQAMIPYAGESTTLS